MVVFSKSCDQMFKVDKQKGVNLGGAADKKKKKKIDRQLKNLY